MKDVVIVSACRTAIGGMQGLQISRRRILSAGAS